LAEKYEEEVKGMKPYVAIMGSTNSANIVVICGSRREPSRVRALMGYVGEVLESKNLEYENIDLGSIELPVFRSQDQNEWDEVTRETVFGGEGFDLESPEVKNRIEEMVQETIGLSERMERNDK
jgi:hypothetical protein